MREKISICINEEEKNELKAQGPGGGGLKTKADMLIFLEKYKSILTCILLTNSYIQNISQRNLIL